MNKIILIISGILLVSLFNTCEDNKNNYKNELNIHSDKKVGQIEIGSPFIGIEIHNSFPMLNRISFYYPVANSIDISNDYWKRELYRVMSAGLRIDDTLETNLINEIYSVDQTPYSAQFTKEKYKSKIKIKYEFCKNEPAMLITYSIMNMSGKNKNYEVFTGLETLLKTSHTYKAIKPSDFKFDSDVSTMRINYSEVDSDSSQIFISNVGLQPYQSEILNADKDSLWVQTKKDINNNNRQNLSQIASNFYKKKLGPGEEIEIKQLIGMVKMSEAENRVQRIIQGYSTDIKEYKAYIRNNSNLSKTIITGDKNLDFTSQWSEAVLMTNSHYLDGDIVPMPAQAEYNFYFTHDALLTDLAAVNFNLARVKNDLEFIIKHADENKIIPHAYYWKDSTYKTEYAGTENWNHFWFTLLAARYLRHSNDTDYLRQIYPYVKKSIDTALKNKEDDNLMYSFRPDWWDIGNNYGPRAYMTILAIRALKEFCYIATVLEEDSSNVQYYNETAKLLIENMNSRLWNDELNYLTSYYEDGSEDTHIYMGSMLASHFNLLDPIESIKLMNTAEKYLLDEKLGIYTLFPMDLHKLTQYLGFAGNEAGEPYYYANGGIWPHGNAWFALGLINNKKYDKAFDFVNKIMTMDGVMNSPNGQPALYEYRISDKNNSEVYGKIDKPQFLWAGGWYLYTLYNLFGLRENEWNISFEPYLPSRLNNLQMSLSVNGKIVKVKINGKGNKLESIMIDDDELNSVIIPSDLTNIKEINLHLGDVKYPYLSKANGIVSKVEYDHDERILSFNLSSMKNENDNIEITSPFDCYKIICDGENIQFDKHHESDNNIFKVICVNEKKNKSVNYKIYFNEL